MFPITVRQGRRLKCWNTNPRSSEGAVMRSPPMRTSPESGGIRPSMIRRRVDFPHPLGPTRQVNVPASNESETSFRTLRSLSPD